MISEAAMYAAALVMGLSAIGYGIAVNNGMAAVAGMVAEDAEKFSKGIIILALAETALVFGLLVAVLLIFVAG